MGLRSSFREINALINIFAYYYQTLMNGGLPSWAAALTAQLQESLTVKNLIGILLKENAKLSRKKPRAQPATENENGTQSEERACELFWCVAGACFAVCCVIFWSQGRRNVQCSVHVHAALHALLSLHPTAHRVLARSARELRHVADAELTPAR